MPVVVDAAKTMVTGDGHQHWGWVLAYAPERNVHHVLYDDGEDEWVHLAADVSAWQHTLSPSLTHGGLPPGEQGAASSIHTAIITSKI